MNRFRTSYTELSVAKAAELDWSGHHLSEKMDGQWHELGVGRAVVRRDKMAVALPIKPNNMSGESLSLAITL